MTAPARRGTTVIADKAVRRIAERAAVEALSAGPQATPPGPVSGAATVRGRRARVALRLPLRYPAPLSDTARDLQRSVTDRTSALTGLDIATPRLSITALVPAATGRRRPDDPAAPADPAEQNPRVPRRWWAARRLPTAALALPAAVVCAAVTVDTARVRLTHQPAAAWRTAAVDWLSSHGPGDPAVTAAAAAVAVLGVWLVVLALTPGRRRLLTVRGTGADCEAAVERATVAGLVREAVGDVPGLGPVTVRAGRRRLTVRAALSFGDLPQARRQAATATQDVLRDCRLRRTPRISVRVTPQPAWQPPPAAPPQERP